MYLNGILVSAAWNAPKELMHFTHNDAYSEFLMTDHVGYCVNLKIIVTKFEQQCYRESVWVYMFVIIILEKEQPASQ